MKVIFRTVGRTQEPYLQDGIRVFAKRLSHYLPFEQDVIPDLRKTKGFTPDQFKQREGEAILQRLDSADQLILLDEGGKSFTSEEFAQWLDRRLQQSARRLVFQVGGAYGFSSDVYQRAQAKVALSGMTFSHQMVRLFFLEQLYRAMTILRNEPYHNR
jgi:23S rRNA (pseudouridine1915-N3)-methyltransferase